MNSKIKIVEKIKVMEVGSLRMDAQNARSHSEEQIQLLAEAIKEYGFNNPVVIDDKNEVKAGHGRIMAAKLLGMKKVPTVYIGHLTKEQLKGYALMDNKIALMSTWDVTNLRNTLKYLDNTEFDLKLTGFSEDEVMRIEDDFTELQLSTELDESKESGDNVQPASGKVTKHESSSVNITLIMSPEQREIVLKAINIAGDGVEITSYGEAVYIICKEYLDIGGNNEEQ